MGGNSSKSKCSQSSITFHKCILITDSVVHEVTRDTPGTHWDWVSMIGDRKVTDRPPVQKRRFSAAMFDLCV
ncbi:hypothetical protein MGN70_009332 [Eutypa lata]|nr:hypothetical protein MGN70_009332 [Eutypa lata]